MTNQELLREFYGFDKNTKEAYKKLARKNLQRKYNKPYSPWSYRFNESVLMEEIIKIMGGE